MVEVVAHYVQAADPALVKNLVKPAGARRCTTRIGLP
jgi:hypothetical protein